MSECVYYADNLRCWRDGRVERLYAKHNEWKLLPNNCGHSGYSYIQYKNKYISHHRLLAHCFLGLKEINSSRTNTDNVIDHIDGNSANNKVSNLRIVTASENQHNRRTAKGYYFNKQTGRWQTKLVAGGENIFLGEYDTETEARTAYLEGKAIYHPSYIHNI